MNICRKLLSIMLCAVIFLSLLPASPVKANPENGFYTRDIEVTVLAYSLEEKRNVPVADAIVTLEKDGRVLAEAYSDTDGIAVISLYGLAPEDLVNATVQAYAVIDRVAGDYAEGRAEVYDHFPRDDAGNIYRFEYQLHSEKIDANGNWRGQTLPFSVSNRADITFLIDASGSMDDDLDNVRENLEDYLEQLETLDFDFRYSVIEYRDYFNKEMPVIYEQDGSHWFTDKEDVIGAVSKIVPDGGGDAVTESLGDTMHWYVMDPDEMDYRNDAFRFVFAITDADNQFEIRGGSGLDQSRINKRMRELCINTSVISLPELEPEYVSLYGNTGGAFFDIQSPVFSQDIFELTKNTLIGDTAEIELVLSEPRMLVNVSLCYLADDEDSQSASYQEGVKNVMSLYSQLMAQTTDGHVYIGSAVLFPTGALMDFFTMTRPACMADIQIHNTVNDEETIRANAMANGIFSTESDYSSNTNLTYFDPPDEASLMDREIFSRIQMSSFKPDYGSIYTSPETLAAVMMHESGHYVFGFFDEYIDPDGNTWAERDKKDKPYYCFGLMDNQHLDIEMSKDYIDYAYLDPYSKTPQVIPYHYAVYSSSCEDVLADLLEDGITYPDTDKCTKFLFTALTEPLFSCPYRAVYTKASYSYCYEYADRTAEYPYAALEDSDFIILDAGGEPAKKPELDMPDWVSVVIDKIGDSGAAGEADYDADDFEEAAESMIEFGNAEDRNLLPVSLKEEDSAAYHILVRKAGENEFSSIALTGGSGGAGTADLPIEAGELAEVVIVREENGSIRYNTFFVDRSEPAEGYLYSSADGKVSAYGLTADAAAYTFVADNTPYQNEDWFSLNQATHVFTDGTALTGGEICSVVSCTKAVDFSSISWFKFAEGRWTKLPTAMTTDENTNVNAKADLDGEGIYVLMGQAPQSGPVQAPGKLKYENSPISDGRIRIIFDDLNADSRYYYVYYSEDLDADPQSGAMMLKVYEAANCEFLSETERALTLDLGERDKMYAVYVETVLEDGSRSGLASVYAVARAADRDGDGIPDWFMDKYGLWSEEHPESAAGNDPDGDGRTNLQEYRHGTDPLVPDTVNRVLLRRLSARTSP